MTAPTTGSAFVGVVPVEGWAQWSLVASADVVALHGYRVDVPAGLRRWTLELDADADADLNPLEPGVWGTYRLTSVPLEGAPLEVDVEGA